MFLFKTSLPKNSRKFFVFPAKGPTFKWINEGCTSSISAAGSLQESKSYLAFYTEKKGCRRGVERWHVFLRFFFDSLNGWNFEKAGIWKTGFDNQESQWLAVTNSFISPAHPWSCWFLPEVYPTEGGLCGSLLGTQRCGTWHRGFPGNSTDKNCGRKF